MPSSYLGTKRPSEGADIRALRGARCLDLSPLSLEKTKRLHVRESLKQNQPPAQKTNIPQTKFLFLGEDPREISDLFAY